MAQFSRHVRNAWKQHGTEKNDLIGAPNLTIGRLRHVAQTVSILAVLLMLASACTERLTKEQASPPTETHRAEFLHLPIPEDTGEGIIMPETKVLGGASERSDSESEERR